MTKKHHYLTWVGIVVLVIVVIIVVRSCAAKREAAKNAKAPEQSVAVTTVIAPLEHLPIYATGIGNVLANASVTVKVRVAGQLESVNFKEGQDVKEGDVLARIDPRPFEATLAGAVAQKARDEALLANALVDLTRYTDLAADDSVAQQILDTQKALVAQDKAAVQSDAASIQAAQVQLDYTTIRSPISGRVGLRLVDPGNIVNTTDTSGVVIVNQITPIALLFTLPEAAFQSVNDSINASGKTPLTVQAFSRDTGAKIDDGSLLVINNQIDTTSGSIQLKGIFANQKHALWPGQFVNVHLILGVKDVVTIPGSAVLRGNNGQTAFVVKPDGTAKNTPIVVALTQDDKAIITKGIQAGDRVVTDGQFKLHDGSKVAEAKPGTVSSGTGASVSADQSAASVASAPSSPAAGASSDAKGQ